MSSAGVLNTRVVFFEYTPRPGPEPGEEEKKMLWECWGEVYEPSMKDKESLSTINVLYAVTVRIRNPLGEYKPSNKHYLSVLNDFYKNGDEHLRFNIKNIHPEDKRFIKIVAEVLST